MGIRFSNNAATTLASSIGSGDASLTVATGKGALFPTLGTGDFFYATLSDGSGNIEIVRVTARATDVFTIERGKDGTSARAWNSADNVALRLPSIALTGLGSAVTVRQSIQSAVLSSGYNNAITTGSGLRPGLDASPTPMTLAFARGFNEWGAQDLIAHLSADASDILGADLAVSSTSFLHATWASPTSVTWGKTLACPQYEYAFDRTRAALLHCEGSNGATTITDDFGNSVTLNASAVVTTTSPKFGSACVQLGSGGERYVRMDSLVDTPHPFEVGFTYEAWINFDTLPGAASNQRLLYIPITAAANDGIQVYFNSSTRMDLIAFGSTTTGAAIAPSTATWYHIALTFDPIAQKLYAYFNGVKSQEIAMNSTGFQKRGDFRWGNYGGGAGFAVQCKIDEIRCVPFCAYPAGTTFTPKASAFTVQESGQSIYFYSIPDMKMYEITGASSSAGTDPTMTARDLLFVAEADTSGAAVTAVRNYAIRAQYRSPWFALPAVSTRSAALTHNLGMRPWQWATLQEYMQNDQGYSVGDRLPVATIYGSGTYNTAFDPAQFDGRNTMYLARNNYSGTSTIEPKTAPNTFGNTTVANLRCRMVCSRGW